MLITLACTIHDSHQSFLMTTEVNFLWIEKWLELLFMKFLIRFSC
jgi:hypothetical protein